MTQLAKRLNNFPEYIFSRMNKVIKEVEKTSGRKVVNLGIGSPDVPPSRLYVDTYKELLDAPNAHMYPGYKANASFTSALISWYKSRFGVTLDEDELLPLLGGKDATGHISLALLDEGDEALVPDPGYPGFSGPILLFGAKVIPYTLSQENGFPIDMDELGKKVTSHTKCIWVNFPSNPTGQIATKEQLKQLVDFAKENNLVLIYDNAYSEITFNGFVAPSILEIDGAKDVAVEIGSFSKSYSFAGYRMGWLVGNREVVSALEKVKSQLDSGMSLPLQELAAFALTHPDEKWHEAMIASYQKRRDIIAKKLTALGLTFNLPKGGLYIWAKIPDGKPDSEEFVLDLLKTKQIFIAPGIAFGENGRRWIRASICADITHIDEYL